MSKFKPANRTAKFSTRGKYVFSRRYGGMSEGSEPKAMHLFRKRKLVRLGILVPKTAEAPVEAPVEAVSEVTEAVSDVTEAVAVSVTEGNRGWWAVTFDDGNTKNMRRPEVEALGLLQPEPETAE